MATRSLFSKATERPREIQYDTLFLEKEIRRERLLNGQRFLISEEGEPETQETADFLENTYDHVNHFCRPKPAYNPETFEQAPPISFEEYKNAVRKETNSFEGFIIMSDEHLTDKHTLLYIVTPLLNINGYRDNNPNFTPTAKVENGILVYEDELSQKIGETYEAAISTLIKEGKLRSYSSEGGKEQAILDALELLTPEGEREFELSNLAVTSHDLET